MDNLHAWYKIEWNTLSRKVSNHLGEVPNPNSYIYLLCLGNEYLEFWVFVEEKSLLVNLSSM